MSESANHGSGDDAAGLRLNVGDDVLHLLVHQAVLALGQAGDVVASAATTPAPVVGRRLRALHADVEALCADLAEAARTTTTDPQARLVVGLVDDGLVKLSVGLTRWTDLAAEHRIGLAVHLDGVRVSLAQVLVSAGAVVWSSGDGHRAVIEAAVSRAAASFDERCSALLLHVQAGGAEFGTVDAVRLVSDLGGAVTVAESLVGAVRRLRPSRARDSSGAGSDERGRAVSESD